MTDWEALRKAIYEAVEELGSLTKFEKAAGIKRIHRFMKGERTDRPGNPLTLEPEKVHKIEAYLARRALATAPAPPVQGDKRREFAQVLTKALAKGWIPEITPTGLYMGDRSYMPSSGLAKDDYDAFAPLLADDLRDELFEAVTEADRLRQRDAARASRRHGTKD